MSDRREPEIAPEPGEEEAAAIVAATHTIMGPASAPGPAEHSSWRFSGRWWSKPVSRRRGRPG